MKRVCLITGSLPPIKCGVGYYSNRLLQELQAQPDLDVTVISTRGVEYKHPQSLRTTKNWGILRLPSLLKQIKQARPDVIHIQYPTVGYKRQLGINLLPYAIRVFLPGRRLIVTLHEYHESRFIGRLRNLITILPIPTIILSNEADRRALPHWLYKRTSIIPLGSNFERVKPRPEFYQKVLADHGLQADKQTLLFFGFAFPYKHLEVLLGALATPVLADYQALLLTDLNGADDYHQSLRQLVETCNNSTKRVAYTGFVTEADASALLQAGQYFVLPQQLPLTPKASTAIIAIQHGLILISMGGADSLEIQRPFESGVNCYLLPTVTAETLAAGVSTLVADPALQHTIKQGAAQLSDYFSWLAIAEAHQELYGR